MTCTRQQIALLMRYAKTYPQKVAAAKAGMSVETARKYLKNGGKMVQQEKRTERTWRTRDDPFNDVAQEISDMLAEDEGFQSQTIMQILIDKYPEKFNWGQLRTLQRRVAHWRETRGSGETAMFKQNLKPGKQSQSDWTNCNELGVTVNGHPFPHLIFHFMLPYSRWETAHISANESFETLTTGYSRAVQELGLVPPEHRTDNLGAAVTAYGDEHVFNVRWKEFLGHYGVEPSANTPGQSNENGSVEKSHHLFKNAMDQALRSRGSRDFDSVAEYEKLIRKVIDQRNRKRRERIGDEMEIMKELPERHWHEPIDVTARVMATSTFNAEGAVYSVPSRLIGKKVRAFVYPEVVRVYASGELIQETPRKRAGEHLIKYRHLIDSLVRKPGAFANWVYRESMFPSEEFTKAHSILTAWDARTADKEYLKVLQYASQVGEESVQQALVTLMKDAKIPCLASIKLAVEQVSAGDNRINSVPDLCSYDSLLSYLASAPKEKL